MKKSSSAAFFLLIIAVITVISISYIKSNKSDNDSDNDAERSKITNNSIYEKLIAVPTLSQFPNLPTGCEATSAAMVMQYYGKDITPEQFADSWLECSNDFYYYEGELFGPDPNRVFAGDPFSENSYGCYADVIVNAINVNSDRLTAEKIPDSTLDLLCEEYIDNNIPLLIWATTSMKKSRDGTVWNLEDGETVRWISGEHCFVLVGYSKDYYFFNDPQSGSIVAYQKYVAEQRFIELGSQAVCIKIR
ncbi:MAG: C39 family peptidase [Acutalibacteraceae bacterium]